MLRIARVGCFVVTTLVLGTVAQSSLAEPPSPASSGNARDPGVASPGAAPLTTGPARPVGQGVAVVALGGAARDEAFALARAIYASRLRPRSLDEVRARVLAGGDPPPTASRELRELAEVRGAVRGDDAASRRLLTGLAQQVGAQALLLVKVEPAAPAAPAPPGPPPAPTWPSFEPPSAAGGSAASDPGAGTSAAGNAAAAPTVVARLFLADAGELDAARYLPEPGARGADAWKSTVTSLEGRFSDVARGPERATPGATRPLAAPLASESPKSEAFYASAWFWGALGAAALVGGAFYFASRGDTSSDPIHLQMRVPK